MDARTVRVVLATQDRGVNDLARQAGVSRFTAWRWSTVQADRVAPATAEKLTKALLEPSGTGGGDPRQVA